MTNRPKVVEICAGAGGQALGLELAGFEHELAVEIDADAAATLEYNRPHWKVAVGDVADPSVWNPRDYRGVDLLAGGVPCPPFSVAGKQLGAGDERDLFAWAVELADTVQPRALLLENVRGLSGSRFTAYRQHVLDRLRAIGYWADWRLLHASDYGVPQLRPRFILVALRPEDAPYFRWPEPQGEAPTVGQALKDLMTGWDGAEHWATQRATRVAPTIVGGSKKHGGADLGPTRAKAAWRELGVDAMGVADAPPVGQRADHLPRLTTEMVARLQGWRDEWGWSFTGKKTSRYRQIGNAFPPPVARAVGTAIREALEHVGEPRDLVESGDAALDPIYKLLAEAAEPMTIPQLARRLDGQVDEQQLQRRLANIAADFELIVEQRPTGAAYLLHGFKGFVGQDDHFRHNHLRKKVS